MEIRNLDNIDFDTLFRAFERAFEDYAIRFDKNEVRSMLTRRGFVPTLSFAAFDNGEIVAFTFVGIGVVGGVPTAYDIGTGTAKDYRGQGLAAQIFSYSLPFLKEAGIRQFLLEVLNDNKKAIDVYRRLGFDVARNFDCFRQNIKDISLNAMATEEIVPAVGHVVYKPVSFEHVSQAQDFCDFAPSWQNSIDSVSRGRSNLTFLGAFVGNAMVGYCVFDADTGDLTQIAVKRGYRHRKIASHLLQEATGRMNTDFIKVLNVSSSDTELHSFLESANIPLASSQLEMTLDISHVLD